MASQRKTPTQAARDAALLTLIQAGRTQSLSYRTGFVTKWRQIESQLRVEHPQAWEQKENWQTKVYVPLQAKASEIASAKIKEMLFPGKRHIILEGRTRETREMDDALMELMEASMEEGGFETEREFWIQEASDLGTSFLKVLADPQGTGLKVRWVSALDVLPDPSARHDWRQWRFCIHEYSRPLQEIIEAAQGDDPEYEMAGVKQLVAVAHQHTQGNAQEEVWTIRNFSGETVPVSSAFRTVTLSEWCGYVPDDLLAETLSPARTETLKVVTVVSGAPIILRHDEAPYAGIPIFPLRFKARKYHLYGDGYHLNTLDIQDLMNSAVNLGFDSLKIASMDIAVVDERKIADESSIVYAPMAIWRMRDVNGAVIHRNPVSSMADIMRGVGMLDAMHQDASGVTRHVQGSAPTTTSDTETLGEYELKLAAVDRRFAAQVRLAELETLRAIYEHAAAIIFDPLLFTQDMANRLIGTRRVMERTEKGEIEREVPRLDLNLLRGLTKGPYKLLQFKATGTQQFIDRVQNMEKLRQVLIFILQTPQIAQGVDLVALGRRFFQLADLPGLDEWYTPPGANGGGAGANGGGAGGGMEALLQQLQGLGGGGGGGVGAPRQPSEGVPTGRPPQTPPVPTLTAG